MTVSTESVAGNAIEFRHVSLSFDDKPAWYRMRSAQLKWYEALK